MIRYRVTGNTKRTEEFLDKMIAGDIYRNLEGLAARGVAALAAATPHNTGVTANSWSYEISRKNGGITIYWTNSNVQNGFSVAIGLQYGHGTGTGGWIEGYDYINPAIRPIFDQIADSVWKEVQNA